MAEDTLEGGIVESIVIMLGGQSAFSPDTLRQLRNHHVDTSTPRIKGKVKIWPEPILRGEESYVAQLEILERSKQQNALQGIMEADEVLSNAQLFPAGWEKLFFYFPQPWITDGYKHDHLVPMLCKNPLSNAWWMQFIWIGHANGAKPKDRKQIRKSHFLCWQYA